MTVAGLLVGGAGTVMQVTTASSARPSVGNPVSGAGLALADRPVSTNRISRSDSRPTPSHGGRVIDMGTCDASYYDHPQPTADGEMFDPTPFTAAHETLPFNTQVRV